MPYVYLSDGGIVEIEQWQAEDEEYLPPSQMPERDWDKLAELFDGNLEKTKREKIEEKEWDRKFDESGFLIPVNDRRHWKFRY